MSIFGGLFRKRPLAELWSEAEQLFSSQRFGEAKLAFDRVEERAAKEDRELASKAQARSAECCDEIAKQRVREADKLQREGHVDLAKEELKHALDTARSEQVVAHVRAAMLNFERRDANEQASVAPAALSAEERLTLLTSSWEPLQAEELERYGEPLLEALLALDDDQPARALELLERVAVTASEASYLHLELARAQLALQKHDDAERSLRTFLSRIGPDEGGAARLVAHRELARLRHEQEDKEGAVRELEAACEAVEDDPRPLLDLGNYLRTIGRSREAIEVLELCAQCFEDGAVEWPVTMEIGLACADAGLDQRAIEALEQVLQTLLSRGHNDLPPQAAVPLAKLHEQQGNLARAADLYRALSQGEDRARHALYHREAGRLLELLGLADEAERMQERAAALEPSPS